MFLSPLPISNCGLVKKSRPTLTEGTCMGYLVSFVLGIFVATVGVGGVATALDKAVQKTQVYLLESAK